MSDALMDLHAHYKAVRARLNGGPPPKPQPLPEPEPEATPAPPVTPPLTALATPNAILAQGLRCAPEVKEKILPVLSKYNLKWVDVAGRSQKWKYMTCRFEVYVTLKAHGWSLSQIGRLCGDRDHTTVLHGIRKFLNDNLTDMQRGICKDLEFCPSQYYVNMIKLREMRNG